MKTIFALAAFGLVLAYYLVAWLLEGKDPKRGTIVPQYEPPGGHSPKIENLQSCLFSVTYTNTTDLLRGILQVLDYPHAFTEDSNCGKNFSHLRQPWL